MSDDTAVYALTLWGGPCDGRTIYVPPEMNSDFYVTDATTDTLAAKHWYRFQPGTGKARWLSTEAK